jgi:MoxR-like ATPase
MEDWKLVNMALKTSDYLPRTLLYGVPGTGKTTAAQRIGKPEKVMNLTLTEETPAAEIRGHFIPVEDRFVWKDGPGITAWRHGARLVANEIDHASGDVHTLLMALLDDPDMAAITLPTGETVQPAPGYHVVATMNGVPEDLPAALRDRFEVAIDIKTPNPDAIKALPEDLRDAASALTVTNDEERRSSLRSWVSFAKLRAVHDEEDAAILCFGKQADAVVDALKIKRGK